MINKDEYKKIVNKNKPKESKFKNFLIAFVSGGTLALICEFLSLLISSWFSFSLKDSQLFVTIIVISLTCLCTALGFFDNFVLFCKCGLIVPTSGFAHSIASAILDYKNDGLITGIGSNTFKLAGSVIVYSIISAFVFAVVKVALL